MKKKNCSTCKSKKFLKDFGKCRRCPDGRQYNCLLCSRALNLAWIAKNRKYHNARCLDFQNKRKDERTAFILDYLKTRSCADCPERDPIVLDFDHVRGIKKASIATLVSNGSSIKLIKAEIRKCVVRCANCHRRITAKRGGWRRYLLLGT